MNVNNRESGRMNEDLAVAFLTREGVEILERNFYSHGSELDIIAKEGGYLCVIEVRYRKNTAFGDPLESISSAKQHHMRTGARNYLLARHLSFETPVRFDVIGILGKEITYIRNAF